MSCRENKSKKLKQQRNVKKINKTKLNTHPLIHYFINYLHNVTLCSSAIVLLILTRVHLANLLYEGLIKTCDNGATYWNHKVLVQALHKGIDSSNTSSLMKESQEKIKQPPYRSLMSKVHMMTGKMLTNHTFVFYFFKNPDDRWIGDPTCCIRCMHLDDCTPYALFTMWGMLCLAHTAASSSSLQEKIMNTN